MRRPLAVLATIVLVSARPAPVAAQDRLQLGAQVSSAVSGQFDRADLGVGGRLSWHPFDLLGVESEITFYPGSYPDRRPFSSDRLEGLFGVTVGPRFERFRPFLRARAGVLKVGEAPEPIACIQIFPPPLACRLASGDTLRALDVGGGVAVFATPMTFLRVDVGDRLIRYPGPVFDAGGTRRDGAFFSHDFRLAAGAGLRF